MLKDDNDSLIAEFKGDHLALEKYIPRIKTDESYADSSYLYYSDKFKGIGFTFSKKLDSLKKMKLYKIQLINNPLPKNLSHDEIPRRELLFEIKELPVADPKKLMLIFEHFKKMNLTDKAGNVSSPGVSFPVHLSPP